MSCDLNQGRKEPCKTNLGGIRNIYIINYNDLPESNIEISDNIISDIGDITPNAYKYELRVSSNSFTENQVGGEGLISFETSLSIVLKKSTYNDQDMINKLVNGRYKVIVEYNNGNLRLMGISNGVLFNANNTSGTALNTFEGYNITGKCLELNMAPYLVSIEGLGINIIEGDEAVDDIDPDWFISTWNADNATSITLPYFSDGNYNGLIDWGDGTITLNSYSDRTHTYSSAGEYTVTVKGLVKGFNFNETTSDNKSRILNISQWGLLGFANNQTHAIGNLSNLPNFNITASDIPDLTDFDTMESFFEGCPALVYNKKINSWDISGKVSLKNTFKGCDLFNEPLNIWDTSSVTNMEGTFRCLTFNNAVYSWEVSNVTTFQNMFGPSFNDDIGKWDVSSAINMSGMFGSVGDYTSDIFFTYDKDVSIWDVSNVQIMTNMFNNNVTFNQQINTWDTSNVVSMDNMFKSTWSFNQPLDNWETGNVVTMQGMFENSRVFNQLLNDWDFSSVVNMQGMFKGSRSYNQLPIWNTSNLVFCQELFATSAFNKNITSIDFTNCKFFNGLFKENLVYNQPMNSFLVGSTQINIELTDMFNGATGFNQPLNGWNFDNVISLVGFMDGKTSADYNPVHYDLILRDLNLNNNIVAQTLDMGCLQVTIDGVDDKSALILNSWTINDCGVVGDPEANEMRLSYRTTRNNEEIKLPYELSGFYTGVIDWGDGTTSVNDYENRTHTYAVPDDYNISVIGSIQGFNFNEVQYDLNRRQIVDISNWGNGFLLTNGFRAFKECLNLDISATDIFTIDSGLITISGIFEGCESLIWNSAVNDLDLSNVQNIDFMFSKCTLFNQNLNSWDTTLVSQMVNLFKNATTFNGDINLWDVSNVQSMSGMFNGATSFNTNINLWDVSNALFMSNMFKGATSFNQPLDEWDMSNTIFCENMFKGATSFNQPLNDWVVSGIVFFQGFMDGATSFNQDLNSWNTNMATTKNMFKDAESFNGNISNWDVSNVNEFNGMFKGATSFNGDLSSWVLEGQADDGPGGGELTLNSMFEDSNYNQSLNTWDTSNVVSMSNMFANNTTFNQPLDSWDTSNVITMSNMFLNSTAFKQPLDSWDFSEVTNFTGFMQGKGFTNYSSTNYDLLLDRLVNNTTSTNLILDMGNIKYTTGAVSDRDTLTNNRNWTIIDGGEILPLNLDGIWRTPIDGEDSDGTYTATLEWDILGSVLKETIYGRTLSDIKLVNNKTNSLDEINYQMTVFDTFNNPTVFNILNYSNTELVVQGVVPNDFINYTFTKL